MSNLLNIKVIVEGQTEEKFIKEVLAPWYAPKNIFFTPILLSKKGQKGGDVKFSRAENDIRNYLKQTNVSIITTFIDFYGIKEWPGKSEVSSFDTPQQIADKINQATQQIIFSRYDSFNPINRFVPFIAVHEFETLLFSDSQKLAQGLGISQNIIDQVLNEFPSPEYINNSPYTAPSKRLQQWNTSYSKTTDGIAIAQAIGIEKIREKCPLFNAWLEIIEKKANLPNI